MRLTSVGVDRVMRATRPFVSKASHTPSLPTMTRQPLSGMRTCSQPAQLIFVWDVPRGAWELAALHGCQAG